MCRSNFYETGIYSCQLEVKNTFKLIKIMKGNLARQMFFAYPELKKELWGGHLWNPSYCAITVSDRSRDQVLSYIEGQKEKEKKKA